MSAAAPRWLLLVHQLPPAPAYLRVKIGRHLARAGAVAIKNSVYALPDGEETREDLHWVRREIVKGGGDASIVEARFVDGLSDDGVVRLFQAERERDYQAIAAEARAVAAELPRRASLPAARRAEVARRLAQLRRRASDVAAIDFFGAAGREVVEGLLSGLEARTRPAGGDAPRGTLDRAQFRGRTWVTRAGIKVDRMASAWLVRRLVDPEARFKFVPAKGYRPEPGELRFDMFEAEFTHEGERCTFEILAERFGLGGDPALRAIGEIVHDLDLKDGRHGREETAGVARLVAGIAAAHAGDEARLERGAALFDDLYASHGGAASR